VNGIDVLLVRPYDLNNGIGHPVTGHFAPERKKDIERIKEIAAKAGKKPGIYATSEDQARSYADQSFDSVRSTATRRNLRSLPLIINP
jgi:2-keto-3-deoxy-L-rhamnonate aldolase RhmA